MPGGESVLANGAFPRTAKGSSNEEVATNKGAADTVVPRSFVNTGESVVTEID